MEEDKLINPVEATEIFRLEDKKKKEKQEFACKFCFLWEDVRLLEEWPYQDDWKVYPGPKYSIFLANYPGPKLILGDYRKMKQAWEEYRQFVWNGQQG